MSTALHLDPGTGLTIVHAAELREQWLAGLNSAHSDVVLSLKQVQEFDSSGVQLLLALARTVQADGHTLTLVAPSKTVRDVFELFQLDTLLALVAQVAPH